MRTSPSILLGLAFAVLLPLGGTASAASTVIPHDVNDLIEDWHLEETVDGVSAVVANMQGDIAVLFDYGNSVRAYKNGTLVYQGKSTSCSQKGFIFRITDDGHVIHTLDCKSLYVDADIISKNNDAILSSVESAIYDNGSLIYPEKDAVKKMNLTDRTSSTLYTVPGATITYIRKAGSHLAYTASKKNTYAMYKNGKKISKTSVVNPWNFVLRKNGDVFYASAQSNSYTLYKNTKTYFTGRGKLGFLYDSGSHLYHIGFTQPDAETTNVYLYKDTKSKNLFSANTISNIEGVMAFQGNNFASRVQKAGGDFYLMKNGKVMGEPFLFESPYNLFDGLFFAANGKVYMRNYDASGLHAYEDGKKILANVLSYVWLIREDEDGAIHVYGTE